MINMIKFDLNRDNLTFIGLVVVVLLLLGQCSSNASMREEINRLEEEVTVTENNLKASLDTVEIVRKKNGTILAEISAFQLTADQLNKTNKKLVTDYTKALDLNKKLKGVNTLLKAEIANKDSIIFNSTLNADSTFSFADSVDYGEGNYRYIWVNGRLMNTQVSGTIDIEQKIKLWAAIEEKDGLRKLKLSTKYPFDDFDLQGISLINDELNIYRKKSRWNINFGFGLGIVPSGQTGLAVTPTVGVMLGYSPKLLQF